MWLVLITCLCYPSNSHRSIRLLKSFLLDLPLALPVSAILVKWPGTDSLIPGPPPVGHSSGNRSSSGQGAPEARQQAWESLALSDENAGPDVTSRVLAGGLPSPFLSSFIYTYSSFLGKPSQLSLSAISLTFSRANHHNCLPATSHMPSLPE